MTTKHAQQLINKDEENILLITRVEENRFTPQLFSVVISHDKQGKS